MADVVVQLEGLRKETIAQAAAQGDAEEVEITSTGFLVDLPTDDAPLDTAANAVTRYRAACHYYVAADMCGAAAGLKNTRTHFFGDFSMAEYIQCPFIRIAAIYS